MVENKDFNLPIPVKTKEDFVIQYVQVINSFIGDNALTKGEQNVLTEIILRDDSTRKKQDRGAMLLDYKTVKEPIMFKLDISQARLYNIILALKRKGALIIVDGNYYLHPIYEISANCIPPFNLLIKWQQEDYPQQ